MSAIKYRRDIDALRGISVSLVVLYHAFPDSFTGGFIGVDVFFVISGFLITGIIKKQHEADNFSILNFYNKRIRRIFPSLLSVILFTLAIGWLVLFPVELKQLGSHLKYSMLFFQNYNLISELGYFDVSSHYKPLLHLWTLSIEEQFYFFWPFILIWIYKTRIRPQYVLGVVILASFAANIFYVEEFKNEVFFNSFTRIWEIGLGAFLALSYSSILGKPLNVNQSRILFLVGLTLIIGAAYWLTENNLYPYYFGLFPTLGAVFIIIANVKLPRWGGLVEIGLISYPLYLWHWVLISFTYIYLGRRPSELMMLSVVGISILFSYLTYKYIERLRYSSSKFVIIGLVSCALFVTLGGSYFEFKDGLPERSQLEYAEKYYPQFVRIQEIDSTCSNYVGALAGDRLIDYCRCSEGFMKSKKRIAIMGDSHASVMFPGIDSIARVQNYNVVMMANSSCPPLIGYMWGNYVGAQVDKCELKIEQQFRVIEMDTTITKVIFVSRGPVYVNGEIEVPFSIDNVERSLDNRPFGDSYSEFADGYENSMGRLNSISHVKEIFYFLENPELGFLPKESLPRPFDVFGISIQANSQPRNLYQIRMKKYKDLILKKSRRFDKLKVIDVESYFCEGEECVSFKDGNFLYADEDHLSIFGSYYLANASKDIVFNKPLN